MQSFTLVFPTTVYFGTDILENAIADETDRISGNILIITTGRSLTRHGHLDRLMTAIRENAFPTEEILVYDGISNNPDITEVLEAQKLGRQHKVSCVIGFGGGSALDAAKAVAAGIVEDVDIEENFQNETSPVHRVRSLIAIPTTAGTGSELSKAAILSDRRQQRKAGLRGDVLIPDIAIVDPSFTWTIGKKITMETGFDTLAHAMETYVAVRATPYSETLSETVMKKGAAALRTLNTDSDDHEARESISFCSMLMGMNLKDVGTCLPHRMQYPIGSVTESTHAAGLAALYPAWIREQYNVSREKIRKILSLLGGDEADSAEDAYTELKSFLHILNIAYTLEELGVSRHTPAELADMVSGDIGNDPLAADRTVMERIYSDAM